MGDLPEFCDFEYIANVARVNAAALGSLALAPAVPQDVKVEIKELTNSTTLVWLANTEPNLAGYKILWRETTAPLWQQSIPAGNATQFTVPKVSKDNFLFGVALSTRRATSVPPFIPHLRVKSSPVEYGN